MVNFLPCVEDAGARAAKEARHAEIQRLECDEA